MNFPQITKLPPTGKVYLQGWCSGPRFSGPALHFKVVVDNTAVANGTASMHRAKAGDHGFVVPVDLSAFETGSHTVAAECDFKGEWFQLRAPFCLKGGEVVAC